MDWCIHLHTAQPAADMGPGARENDDEEAAGVRGSGARRVVAWHPRDPTGAESKYRTGFATDSYAVVLPVSWGGPGTGCRTTPQSSDDHVFYSCSATPAWARRAPRLWRDREWAAAPPEGPP